MSQSTPHPRCFAQRVRQAIETNEASVEKSGKREKSPQESENTGFTGTYREQREKAAEMMAEVRVGQKEKSLASVDECIVVSAGSRSRRCFLALRRARLKVATGKPQRLISSTTYGMGYARTTGRKDGFGCRCSIFSAEDEVCRALNEQIQNPHP